MDYAENAMELHRKLRGKLEMHTRTETGTHEALLIAYTPGVAAPCLAIKEDPAQSYELTRRWNTVAVVTDGTAVLVSVHVAGFVDDALRQQFRGDFGDCRRSELDGFGDLRA